MLGAIAGDVIGSVYEHNNTKTKDFPLFVFDSRYTDDTVMTLAVAEALIRSYPLSDPSDAAFETAECMHRWGKMFPYAGYGGKFMDWIRSDSPEPYGSLGNGSAMRVSSAAWVYRGDLEMIRAVARATAMPTHNHEEGIKGAEAVASAIGLALEGKSKDEIRKYIEEEFHYDLSRTLDEIRPDYKMDPTCPGSVPEAIIAFLEGQSFEDVIRGAISIGGDSDTIAAIAGSIAEAFYGIPAQIIEQTRACLTVEQNLIVDCFEDFRAGNKKKAVEEIRTVSDWNLAGMNRNIEATIELYNGSHTEDTYAQVLSALDYNRSWGKICVLGELEDPERGRWVAAVTGRGHIPDEVSAGGQFVLINDVFRQMTARRDVRGMFINPWSQDFKLSIESIRYILKDTD